MPEMMKSTRQAYGETLAMLGEKNDKIVVLDADLSGATKTAIFKKKFPNRFYNCGIAEGNMMTVASGLASVGLIPFVSSFAMFPAGRAYEHIRNGIAYPKLNVKICATHAGITVGEDGATHQCIEDLALMRVIPNMLVFSPADAIQTAKMIEYIADIVSPCYVRLGRADVPMIFDENYKFDFAKADILANPLKPKATIISTGYMTHIVMEAVKNLTNLGIDIRHINIHTIKPIDSEIIIKSAKETGMIFTVEEHSIIGGLGGAVAEVVSENAPCPVIKIGINDTFGRSGKIKDLLNLYCLTAEHIIEKVIAHIKK